MAIKIQNTTVINDSLGLENITNLKTINSESILGTGDIAIDGLSIRNEAFATVTSSAGAATINASTATMFSHSLTENTTYTFSNPPSNNIGYGFTLKVVQSSTARTITWPNTVRWAAATAPTLSTGSGDVDVFVFFTHDNGTNWYGFVGGQDLS